MRLMPIRICLVAVLASCDALTEPPMAVPTSALETTVRVSPSEVSHADPPDSVVVRIRIRNTLPFRVLVAQDSSLGTLDEPFIGYGVRWRFELRRVDAPGVGGASGGLAWQEIHLGPGDWADFTHVIRPFAGDWNGWDGEYAVHAFLQGEALPVRSLRFVP